MKNWFQIFENRVFTLLFLSQAAMSAGVWVGYIVIPLALYQKTQDPVSIGILMSCRLVPPFLLGPWVSWQLRRTSPRNILLAATWMHVAVFIGYLFTSSPQSYYLLAILIAVARAFLNPAKLSWIPSIIPEDKLPYANSALSGMEQMAIFLGPATGGILIQVLGSTATILICAILFGFAFLFLLSLKQKGSPAFSTSNPLVPGIWSALRGVFLKKWLAWLIVGDAVAALAFGALNVVVPVLSKETFPELTGAYGYFMSALGAGILLGTLCGPLLLSRFAGILIYLISTIFAGISLVTFGYAGPFAVAVFLIFLVGFGNGVQDNSLTTFIQRQGDEKVDMATAFSVYQSLTSLCVLLAVVIATTFMKIVGIAKAVQWLGWIPVGIGGVLFLLYAFENRNKTCASHQVLRIGKSESL